MKPKSKPKTPKVNADFEFFDRTSRRVEFLYEDPWRVFRIQSDLIQSVGTMDELFKALTSLAFNRVAHAATYCSIDQPSNPK